MEVSVSTPKKPAEHTEGPQFDDEDWGDSGDHTERDTADHDSSGAGLGGGGEVLCWLVGIAGEELGEEADGAASDETSDDGNEDAPVTEDVVCEWSGNNSDHDGSTVGTGSESPEELPLVGVFLGSD